MSDERDKQLSAVMQEVSDVLIKRGYTGFVGYLLEPGHTPAVVRMASGVDKFAVPFVNSIAAMLMQHGRRNGQNFEYHGEVHIYKPKK